MVEIKWTDFGDYIEKDSFRYAEIVVNSLFNATDILEQNPLAGRVVPEFNNKNI